MYQDRGYTAVVTGFGPFGCHTVNASWEAVKELSKLCATSKQLKDVRVIVKEIPVSYEDVDSYIPKLWKEYSPIVVLHVGVSHKASCLTIESYAHSSGYTRPDIYQKLPIESNTDFKIFQTELDVTKICDTVNGNSGESECKACISKDAGRYLCEYVFCRSLQIQPTRTLFIHVPDFDKYSSTRIANGLYNTLCCAIEHVKRNQE